MIGKISKGRSFSGLLVYLFKPIDKEQPNLQEIHEQKKEPEQALNGPEDIERDRAGPEQAARVIDPKTREHQNEPAFSKDENKSRGKIIAGNMAGRNAKELWHEFDAMASLNPEVERKVFHCAIGIPKEDQVSSADKVQIAEKFAGEMGLKNTMWLAVEHDEHDHKEIHFVASLIDYDGNTISDSKDYERAEEIMRRTEQQFGLREVESSREAMRRCPTQEEMKYFERTGVISTRMRLQAHIDEAIGIGATATELIERLEEKGVQVVPYIDEAGEARGISFRLDEKLMKGSDLGRGYSWPGLQKDWPKHREYREGKVTYEHQRDYEAISQARSREDERRRTAAEQSREHGADERSIKPNRAVERDSQSTIPHRRESNLAAAKSSGDHEAAISALGSGRQKVQGDRSAPGGSGEANGATRSLSERESERNRDAPAKTNDRVRDTNKSSSLNGGQGLPRFLSESSRQHQRSVESGEVVSGDDAGVQDSHKAVLRSLREGQHDDNRPGTDGHYTFDRSQRQVNGDDREIESTVRQNIRTTRYDALGASVHSVRDAGADGGIYQHSHELNSEQEFGRAPNYDFNGAVSRDHTGDSQAGDRENSGADERLGSDSRRESSVRRLSLNLAASAEREGASENPAGEQRTETETRRPYKRTNEISNSDDERHSKAIPSSPVDESLAFERLRQLTGVQESSSPSHIEKMEQVTGIRTHKLDITADSIKESVKPKTKDIHDAHRPEAAKEQPVNEKARKSVYKSSQLSINHGEGQVTFESKRETEYGRQVTRKTSREFGRSR